MFCNHKDKYAVGSQTGTYGGGAKVTEITLRCPDCGDLIDTQVCNLFTFEQVKAMYPEKPAKVNKSGINNDLIKNNPYLIGFVAGVITSAILIWVF